MIVLDENIVEQQIARLRRRIRLCQIGHDIGRRGMSDEAIIPLLRTLRRPTFITADADFFDKSLCDLRYCLAYFDVSAREIADYVARLLRHADFRTWSQRRGRVLRVAPTGITAWAVRTRPRRHTWDDD